jgi:RNA polymerase sigma factor (sigma-70 family)
MTELTNRERQVIHLIAEGLSNREIARRLNVSEATIKVHVHHMLLKLRTRNRTALAMLALSRVGEDR